MSHLRNRLGNGIRTKIGLGNRINIPGFRFQIGLNVPSWLAVPGGTPLYDLYGYVPLVLGFFVMVPFNLALVVTSLVVISIRVLHREGIFGFFCPKQGQGLRPSAAHLYSNIGRVPTPPPGWVVDMAFLACCCGRDEKFKQVTVDDNPAGIRWIKLVIQSV